MLAEVVYILQSAIFCSLTIKMASSRSANERVFPKRFKVLLQGRQATKNGSDEVWDEHHEGIAIHDSVKFTSSR